MDEPTVDIEREIALLRDELARAEAPPLGLASRLEAGFRTKVSTTNVSWEPRVVVACIIFAVGASASGIADPSVAVAFALGAVVYGRLAVKVR